MLSDRIVSKLFRGAAPSGLSPTDFFPGFSEAMMSIALAFSGVATHLDRAKEKIPGMRRYPSHLIAKAYSANSDGVLSGFAIIDIFTNPKTCDPKRNDFSGSDIDIIGWSLGVALLSSFVSGLSEYLGVAC